MKYSLTRAAVKAILEHADDYEWSLQGFGMLRCYLSKTHRLHVWSTKHKVVSNIHNHPWDFTSYVLSGSIRNQIYYLMRPDAYSNYNPEPTHSMQTIQCGPGGHANFDIFNVCLSTEHGDSHTYKVGDSYDQGYATLHESVPSDGCVTIIERRNFQPNDSLATVAVPIGEKFVFVEPRKATAQEVEDIISNALAKWDKY